MKQCRPGKGKWIAAVFVFLLLSLFISFSLYQLTSGEALASDERNYMLLGLPLFGGVFIYLVCHLRHGLSSVHYDEQRIVFQFADKQEKSYFWTELATEKITITQNMLGYVFVFPSKK